MNPRFLITTPLCACILALLSGCASLQDAGHSSYVLKPGPEGYTLEVRDGKEYDGRQVQFRTDGKGAILSIAEGESKAFKGQGIAAKGLTLFPVTGLNDLLGGGK